MVDDAPYKTLIERIDQASRRRDVDAGVRGVEAAARRQALGQIRESTRSRLSDIRDELRGIEDQRRFTRLRIRHEMRAQLRNLHADVERLKRQVQTTLDALKGQSATLAATVRQRVAELRADAGVEAMQRREDTRNLLNGFSQARAEKLRQMRRKLNGYCDGLRQTTAKTLGAYRAERALLHAAWQGSRSRRAGNAPPPVTLIDPRTSAPDALTPNTLVGAAVNAAASAASAGSDAKSAKTDADSGPAIGRGKAGSPPSSAGNPAGNPR